MKSQRKELWLNIPTRRGFVNIMPQGDTIFRQIFTPGNPSDSVLKLKRL